MQMPPSPPWTAGQLRRLGICLRDQTPVPSHLPQYEDVMEYYNEVAVYVQDKINPLDWDSLLTGRPFKVTSRLKTLDTLTQKLNRDHSYPLPAVQDIAGVRFEAEMTLDEQDAVAGAIVGMFDQDPRCIHDMRSDPHSGYRAVHVWLRLPVRVEVQVRTQLQGLWANMYESAADVLGRGIRYGELPTDSPDLEIVTTMQDISVNKIAPLEHSRNELIRIGAEAKASLSRLRSLKASGLDSASEQFQHVVEQLETNQREAEAFQSDIDAEETEVRASLDSWKTLFDSIREERG
ncbi:GTP pyrophosphokinase family protein (plasmid) [Pseudarthrobacter psychrotolerans]|uniref:GTP pyrophosphokinase family protein n=1 Tax=Pseudarthrobacter psychrotolerans TaxID=2697569 RepID=A0A6P1NY48_9MICC|nr:GTP pyrophosphokinase family protein [Pseudarthrobacter psychrotolerans]QHK22552.1 GTP pyrophosphokinase family protein [Pseudarthrobacter psychrotolerans]